MTTEKASSGSFGVTASQSLQHLTSEAQLVGKAKDTDVGGAETLGSKTYQQQAPASGQQRDTSAEPKARCDATS